jgi:hypothetical protein
MSYSQEYQALSDDQSGYCGIFNLHAPATNLAASGPLWPFCDTHDDTEVNPAEFSGDQLQQAANGIPLVTITFKLKG